MKKIKEPTPYEVARDEYGLLDKQQKNFVLNRVSQLTDRTSGAEAESAFIQAVAEAKNYAQGGFYSIPFAF